MKRRSGPDGGASFSSLIGGSKNGSNVLQYLIVPSNGGTHEKEGIRLYDDSVSVALSFGDKNCKEGSDRGGA